MPQVTLADAARLFESGQFEAAEAACRTILSTAPDDAPAWHVLGLVLHRAARLQEAVDALRRAVQLNPKQPYYRINLGGALGAVGRADAAIGQLAQAMLIKGDIPELHNNMGAAFEKDNRLPEAALALKNALAMRPDYLEAHRNRGNVLRKLGRVAEAAGHYRRALELQPDDCESLAGLSSAFSEMADTDATIETCGKIVTLRPRHVAARSALLYTLHYSDAFDAETLAREHFEWDRLFGAKARSGAIAAPEDPSTPPVRGLPTADCRWPIGGEGCGGAALFHPRDGMGAANRMERPGRSASDPVFVSQAGTQPRDFDELSRVAAVPQAMRRLRVGYVSPDFRDNTIAKFITGALEHHDREQFELFCYSDVEKPDDVTRGLRSLVPNWHETRKLNDAELETLIREHRIDILVDLRGHAAGNRLTLFARKPAPVQVNMVGYFNTTGLSAMDWRLTDAHMDPPGVTERLNSERLMRIEPSCWCYSPAEGPPDVADTPALAKGYVTFGSLNKIVKVSPTCARLWARVLDAVPNSRLMLSVPKDAEASVRERLAKLGLPLDRLDIPDKTRTTREYLERYHQIDIALDTYPFGGITTTCDALWMGVPCVSLAGGTSVSRAGKSILHAAGLGHLAADTPEQFVKIACDLARDIDALRELRASMRERLVASPLMDHVAFARKLDAVYRAMWREWCAV